MTSEELTAALDANDAEGCIAILAGATEAERRAVAKLAAGRLRAVTADVPAQLTSILSSVRDDDRRRLFPAASLRWGGLRAAQVAVLGTATLVELKKHGERCVPPIADAVAVLSARRPPWVGEWAEAILAWGATSRGHMAMPGYWRLVRGLVRERLCARPRSAAYIHGMIIGISASSAPDRIRQALLDDPGLLEDEIWDVFESEPMPGMLELFPISASIPSEFRWEVALAGLADEGRLSRARLLDARLGGLERDFHEMRARWFALMHETLRPTLDERAERVDRYLGLAASRNASTVTFSLKALGVLDDAHRLEPGPLVAAVGPALLARAKGAVLSALGLIERAAHRAPDVRAGAAAVAIDALAHESPEVHEAVLDLVERHGERTDQALADLLRSRADTVAASQRGRVAAWLCPQSAPEGPDTISAGLDDLLARASALDARLADLAGVPVAVEVLKQRGGEIPAVDFAEMDVPRLDPGQVIAPVADLDELIGLFSTVLENCRNPDDLERVLDGVSRLCDRLPYDFAARTGPLKARAERVERILSPLVQPVCGLALAWITGRSWHVQYADVFRSLVGLYARRVLATARRAAVRQAAPLLSAPTHRGGWIDPRVLVERVKLWASTPLRLDRLDGSMALLRLAPDAGPRAEALRSAAGLEGPYAAALRHALGGEGETVGPDARIWVAAARARAPRDDDPRVEARHPGLGPDAARAASCSLKPGPHKFADRYTQLTNPLIERQPPLPTVYKHDLPTVLLHDHRARGALAETCWMATIWPLGRDSFFAAAAETILGLECSPFEARSYRSFLEALLDADVPLRTMARLLLAGALSANTTELQGLAADALIAAVDDGRIDGQLLGEAMHRLVTEGLAKPARLARALGDVALVSPLHARVIARALQLTVIGLTPPPRDLHAVLELLKELLIETGERLSSPGTEEYLRGLKVAGKTAKLARELLGFEGRSDSSSRLTAAARALAGRVERAERWTRCCHRAAAVVKSGVSV